MNKSPRSQRRWRWKAAFAALLLPALSAYAGAHRSAAWARTHFEAAQRTRQELDSRPTQERTRREYERAISAYRQVYYGAPTSAIAAASVAESADLMVEMGRQFDDPKILEAAIRQYQFLRKEYPSSKDRFDALLAIGQIYKDDLDDCANAQRIFEDFLRRYPRHRLADDARDGLRELTEQASLKTKPAEILKSPEEKKIVQSESSDISEGDSDSSDRSYAQVNRIRHWSTPDYTRITIDLDSNISYESQRIENPDRIYFDLAGTQLAATLIGKTFDVDDGFVKQIRVAQYQRGRTRVVLDIDNRSDYDSSLLADPPRLVINLHRKPSLSIEAKSQSSPSKPPTGVTGSGRFSKKVIVEADEDESPDRIADAADIKPVSRSAGDAITDRPSGTRSRKSRSLASGQKPREARPTASGDRSLIRALGLKIGKIVIDPGHGGFDTGTIGPKGLLEKDLVLDVSRRLGKLLEIRLGADVVYTRDDDTFIPLETRTSIANQEQADLFVSVHANSSRDPDARGVETYYLNFTSSAEALEVASRENAVSDKSIHELQDLVKKIALKEKIEESREFASNVQQALHSGLASKSPAIRDRGVKKAPFIVLIGANMPSILAEISFVSNPTDERRLKTGDHRQRIAECLYRGISKYVGGLSGVKVASKMEKGGE